MKNPKKGRAGDTFKVEASPPSLPPSLPRPPPLRERKKRKARMHSMSEWEIEEEKNRRNRKEWLTQNCVFIIYMPEIEENPMKKDRKQNEMNN